jgi:hypothetical protein
MASGGFYIYLRQLSRKDSVSAAQPSVDIAKIALSSPRFRREAAKQ